MWHINFWPDLTHHVFLSHSREDRNWLIEPIHRRLRSKHNVLSWFDQHDNPRGTAADLTLQDGLLKSRHCIFFLTEGSLSQPRGWNHWEGAFATIIQRNLSGSIPMMYYPLIISFVERGDPRLAGTAWSYFADSQIVYLNSSKSDPYTPESEAAMLDLACSEIVTFLLKQSEYANDIVARILQDKSFNKQVRSGTNPIWDKRADRARFDRICHTDYLPAIKP